MSDMSNPTFRKNYAQSQAAKTVAQTQPMREFNVGVEEDDLYPPPIHGNAVAPPEPQYSVDELEQKIIQARRDKAAGIERVSDQAKKRIEMLTGIGRLNKDVVLEDRTFSLRTLKAKETKDASMAILKCDTQLEAGFESRRQQVARAIYQIDGREIDLVLGNDSLEIRLEFIDNLEESVLGKLFDEFAALKTESSNKYSIKTSEDVKEVSEDLKK